MKILRLTAAPFLVLVIVQYTFAQQIADPLFNTQVERPTYTRNYPRVLFDEAHNNFHTAKGRYKPFADLITNDGYNIISGFKPFTKESLETFKILIIANALGAEDDEDDGADSSAFTEAEIGAVHQWVRQGGALLLIADHAPFGGAAEALGKQFGVEMSRGFAFDLEHSLDGAVSILVFSRENNLLLDHPITRGRDENERINRIVTFTGQALKAPDGAAVFLKLGDGARDKPSHTAETSVPVGGQAQGIAFKYGKGRVVMLGEAAMLSAQIAGSNKTPMGMNAPENDNRQLALNIMHWLSGALK
ncbi:MAG TPA: hypothetical protein VI750_12050 [Pyrinomonadaceae bacterium]|nr:hypothetical protein [Pyrinomonadaceae bacterium]